MTIHHFPPIKAYQARLEAANGIIAEQNRMLAEAHGALKGIADAALSALVEQTDPLHVLSQINNTARATILAAVEGNAS